MFDRIAKFHTGVESDSEDDSTEKGEIGDPKEYEDTQRVPVCDGREDRERWSVPVTWKKRCEVLL